MRLKVSAKWRSFCLFWHFHKNIRSCVENECCFPRTVNISSFNFTSNISIPPEPVLKNMEQQMSGSDNSNGERIRHESEGLGVRVVTTGRDIFCLKNFDTCTKTSIRVSKMNAVAHAQLRFQVLTWLQNPLLYSMVTFNLIWSLAAVGHI